MRITGGIEMDGMFYTEYDATLARRVEAGPEYFPESRAEQFPVDRVWDFIKNFILDANINDLDARKLAWNAWADSDLLSDKIFSGVDTGRILKVKIRKQRFKFLTNFRDEILPMYFVGGENSDQYIQAKRFVNAVIAFAKAS